MIDHKTVKHPIIRKIFIEFKMPDLRTWLQTFAPEISPKKKPNIILYRNSRTFNLLVMCNDVTVININDFHFYSCLVIMTFLCNFRLTQLNNLHKYTF